MRGLLPLALLALGACTDRSPVGPARPVPENPVEMRCTVQVRAATMSCVSPLAPGESLGDRIVGGNQVYVNLASSNLAYDTGTEVFSADVTLQNLASAAIGTTDGINPQDVRVFFHDGPTGTGGAVSVRNEDGTATFTETLQPYFAYAGILQPMEISAARTWEFNVDDTVTSFTFSVYVSAPMQDESGAVPLLDEVWTGVTDALWSVASNWSTSQVPDSTSVVTVPADSLLASPNFPVLTANAKVASLRVGYQSTLGLAGFTLEVTGNVDATGPVQNGTLLLSGSGVVLNGTVNALKVTGSSALQGTTKATSAVNLSDGSLTLNGHPLNIAVP